MESGWARDLKCLSSKQIIEFCFLNFKFICLVDCLIFN